MAKYYKVWLNEKFVGYKSAYLLRDDKYIICKLSKSAFLKGIVGDGKFIFKEIITNKNVYPSQDTNVRGLTYAIVCEKFGGEKRIIEQYEEITAIEVQEWLKSMDTELLKSYLERIYTLEEKAIAFYEKEKEKRLESKNQEKIASKSVKRTLKKIKNI